MTRRDLARSATRRRAGGALHPAREHLCAAGCGKRSPTDQYDERCCLLTQFACRETHADARGQVARRPVLSRIRRLSPRSRETASQAVDVLEQIARDGLPKRIEDELNAFAPRELRGRHKIGVAGDKNDDVGLALQRNRGDIEADPHIDALLMERGGEVTIREFSDRRFAAQEASLWLRLQDPGPVAVPANLSQSHGEIGSSTKGLEQLVPEECLLGSGVVDGGTTDGRVPFLLVRPRIVVEAAIEQRLRVRNVMDLIQLAQVTLDELTPTSGSACSQGSGRARCRVVDAAGRRGCRRARGSGDGCRTRRRPGSRSPSPGDARRLPRPGAATGVQVPVARPRPDLVGGDAVTGRPGVSVRS